MLKTLIIFLLIVISSQREKLELGVETKFQEDKYVFYFTVSQPDFIFFQVKFDGQIRINFEFQGETTYTTYSKENGISGYFKVSGVGSHVVYLYQDSAGTGTIWVNPSKNILKLDLNKRIEWKFDTVIRKPYDFSASKLTFSIEKAEKNVQFIFKYKNKVTDNGIDINVPNIFQVCKEQDCQGNITTYDFKQGESYKIYANVYNLEDAYILPAFHFCDKANNAFGLKFNFWIIILFFLV